MTNVHKHLHTAITELQAELAGVTDPDELNLRETIQAEIAVISAAWSAVTGGDDVENQREFIEASAILAS